MKISAISQVNPAFKAHFIPDSKGILNKVLTENYYTNGISEKTSQLADEFNKLGENQELVILDEYSYNYGDTHEHGLNVLNKSTGKIGIFYGGAQKPFWDGVLEGLVKNKDFYKTNTGKSNSNVIKSLLNG